MTKYTIEVDTELDAGTLMDALAGIGVDGRRILDATTLVRLDGRVTLKGDIPEHVDPNGLVVRFAIGGEYLRRAWLDVHWLPRAGEAISLSRLDAGDGYAAIEAVMWEESNLATILLVSIDEQADENDGESERS